MWNYGITGGTSMQHNEATSMYINTSEGRKGEYDKTSNQNIHKTPWTYSPNLLLLIRRSTPPKCHPSTRVGVAYMTFWIMNVQQIICRWTVPQGKPSGRQFLLCLYSCWSQRRVSPYPQPWYIINSTCLCPLFKNMWKTPLSKTPLGSFPFAGGADS